MVVRGHRGEDVSGVSATSLSWPERTIYCLADAYVQVQVHAALEQLLDLVASRHADGADRVAVVSDHHLADASSRNLSNQEAQEG
jgi:hypothetical protein